MARRGGRNYLATLEQLRLASRDFDREDPAPDDRPLLRMLNLNMRQGLQALSIRPPLQAATDVSGCGDEALEGDLAGEQEHDADEHLLA